MLNYKYGATLYLNKIPIHTYMKKILKSQYIQKKYILNSGDNYDLIVIANSKYRNRIKSIAKKNNVKISLVGKTMKQLKILDDSNNTLNISKEFDHFS